LPEAGIFLIMEIYDIIIVGAGPAGMMAAIRAGEFNKNVILIEKNKTLARKLLISGKGRCNLTNIGSLDDFLNNFSKTGEFLRNAFKIFFNRELQYFFQVKGLKLKTERGGRVFPADDQASSVVKILKSYLKENNVKILYNKKVVSIAKGIFFSIRLSDKGILYSKRLIIATGGLSYPSTGSNGDGFRFARSLRHGIVDLRPGLIPLEIKEKQIARNLQGLSLRSIRIRLHQGRKRLESEIGEMLFTHFGVSGPLILKLSGQIVDWLRESEEPVELSIDLKPGLSQEQLDRRLLREFKKQGSKIYKNILFELLPQKMINVFIDLSGIRAEKKVNQITYQERRKISKLLKDFSLTIVRSRPIEEAIITRGGISTKEIDPRTLQSRIVRGLYFCGEIIDVDAISGGYNLQAAFSTGYLAGESASQGV
jgi:hypothetical protein